MTRLLALFLKRRARVGARARAGDALRITRASAAIVRA
jgi:hypothetical protein